jgi:hypothetical protein
MDITDVAVEALRRGAPIPTVPTREQQDALDQISLRIATIRAEAASLDRWVALARGKGASWSDIGIAAGMSKQAAHKRWGDSQ